MSSPSIVSFFTALSAQSGMLIGNIGAHLYVLSVSPMNLRREAPYKTVFTESQWDQVYTAMRNLGDKLTQMLSDIVVCAQHALASERTTGERCSIKTDIAFLPSFAGILEGENKAEIATALRAMNGELRQRLSPAATSAQRAVFCVKHAFAVYAALYALFNSGKEHDRNVYESLVALRRHLTQPRAARLSDHDQENALLFTNLIELADLFPAELKTLLRLIEANIREEKRTDALTSLDTARLNAAEMLAVPAPPADEEDADEEDADEDAEEEEDDGITEEDLRSPVDVDSMESADPERYDYERSPQRRAAKRAAEAPDADAAAEDAPPRKRSNISISVVSDNDDVHPCVAVHHTGTTISLNITF